MEKDKTKRRSPQTAIVGNEHAEARAQIIMAEDRQIVAKKGVRLTDGQADEALERLSCGDTMKNVTRDLGISRSALLVRAYDDEDFGRKLAVAMEMSVWTGLEDSIDGLKGGECSTGSVERDRAIADFWKWMASKLNRPVFGDRMQIDQRSVTINLPDWTEGL